MPNVMPSEPFSALADVYTVAGFARYGEELIPRLMDLVFSTDWVGRTMLDVGSGTGQVAVWLAGQGYRVFALDSSPAMLQIAQAQAEPMGLGIEWQQGDMRNFKIEAAADVAFCLGNTLNLLLTIAELEAAFRQIHAALDPGKLFFFDFRTIRGLAAGGRDQIVFDDGDNALVVTHGQFSYETLLLTTTYQIVTYNGIQWRRASETHQQRGYPIEAIRRLLTKIGFKLLRTMNTALETVDPTESDQLVLLAQKEG